jgi:diadenosine tetraphosphate (Ap4A) HIT family hydrolase
MHPNCEICPILATSEPGLVFETPHWRVTLAKDQTYLGRAFVTAKRHAPNLSALTTGEWDGLKRVIAEYEQAVTAAFGATLFNWGCLMNDTFKSDEPAPHVHWHVRPRYRDTVIANGQAFADPNFAHHYDRHSQREADGTERAALADLIGQHLKD